MQLVVANRRLRGSHAFETYFRYAAERQAVYLRRLRNDPPPWTDDLTLRTYRFTNSYRVLDRTTQFLVREVLAEPNDVASTVCSVLTFKVFNRIETWQEIRHHLGPISADSLDPAKLTDVLDRRQHRGDRIYSGAYIMPAPRLGGLSKHANHARLLAQIASDGTVDEICAARSLEQLYRILRRVPTFGPFLAFQYAIDLNYAQELSFSEGEFVIAGPGACDGIGRCFGDLGRRSFESVIHAVTESAADRFSELGLRFPTIGTRALQPVDHQNLFCELDKYCRAVHPTLASRRGRTHLKRRFRPSGPIAKPVFPRAWGVGDIADRLDGD